MSPCLLLLLAHPPGAAAWPAGGRPAGRSGGPTCSSSAPAGPFSNMTFKLLLLILPGVLSQWFSGSGEGDSVEWLDSLNTARSQWSPNPFFQDVSQLYNSDWNAFVEGPTWGAWWTQNSYGPSFAALPFLQEPYVSFLNNSNNF